MGANDWLPIATYATIGEAEVAASALRAAGIEALVRDGFTAASHPDLTIALGGIGLLVPMDDAEEARALIVTSHERVESETGDFECAECGRPLAHAMAACETCNAGEVRELKPKTMRQAYAQLIGLKLGVLVVSVILFSLPFLWDRLIELPETVVRGAAYGAVALIGAFAIVRFLKQSDQRL